MGGGAAGRTFSQIWLMDKATYPLFAAMTAGIAVLGMRLYHSATSPDVCFSKTRRGNWEHWTTDDDKKEGASFRNHSIRGFFQSVKPSMMPGLNESMSK